MMRTIGFSRSFVELCRKTEGRLAPALVSLFRPVWFQIWFQITPETASAADTTASVARSSRSPCYRSLGSDSSSSKAFAACRSVESNPSVNQP